MHGAFKIGYLWQLIRAGFTLAAFWWIREVAGFHAPGGLPTPLFILMGLVPWLIFSGCVSRVMEAVRTNKALLTFPQITPLDLYISSAVVIAATEVVVLLIFLLGLNFGDYDVTLYAPLSFILCLIGVSALGLGAGLVLSAMNLYLSFIEKIVPMVMRIGFFATGVFFSPSQMIGRYGEGIMWIPTANYIEILRSAFTGHGISPLVKVEYTAVVTIVSLTLGLLLERHVRQMQEVS
jgi:ABC-type polysaccharide/polyol phosphate export systems, permease component